MAVRALRWGHHQWCLNKRVRREIIIGKFIEKTILINIGVLICAVGNVLFAIPNHITAGGITGISTLLYYWFHWNIGVAYFLLNVPLFLIAWRISKSLFFQSIAGMILYSIVIGLIEPMSSVYGVKQLWAGSVVGGLLMGFGLGLMSFANASLGGGSLTGKMLNMKYGFSFSLSTLLIDASVLPFAWFSLGAHQTFFSIILVICNAIGIRIVDFVFRSIWTSKNLILTGDKLESK
jgi:uncharacterized membrane-anchored protein YitT (DUF2179 family)